MSDPVRLQLLKQIGSADHVDRLRNLRDQVHEHMEALLPTRPVEQFNEQLNEVHDAVIQRSIILAEAEMARRGNGSPPCLTHMYCSAAAVGKSKLCQAIKTAELFIRSSG